MEKADTTHSIVYMLFHAHLPDRLLLLLLWNVGNRLLSLAIAKVK